jgi:hypothetical protein
MSRWLTPAAHSSCSTKRCLLGDAFFDQAIDALVGRIAASLRILGCAQSLIGRALSTLSELPSFVGHALRVVRSVLCGFGRGAYSIEIFNGDGVRTAGSKDNAANECRKFLGHWVSLVSELQITTHYFLKTGALQFIVRGGIYLFRVADCRFGFDLRSVGGDFLRPACAANHPDRSAMAG